MKYQCRECGGARFCKHHNIRYYCKECKGQGVCEHGIQRAGCKECGGTNICGHGNYRYTCRECKGAGFCKHDRLKPYCPDCKGSRICIMPFCTTIVDHKGGMCKTCSPTPSKASRCGEIRMAAQLREWAECEDLPCLYTSWNKQNPEADPNQCGKYRPDFVYAIEDEQRIVILEYDEHAHRHYPLRCELARQGELALGYGGRPVHIIRYNPDALLGCYASQTEREALLLERLQLALEPTRSAFETHLTVEYLFYPPYGDGQSTHVMTFSTVIEYDEWASWSVGQCGQ